MPLMAFVNLKAKNEKLYGEKSSEGRSITNTCFLAKNIHCNTLVRVHCRVTEND